MVVVTLLRERSKFHLKLLEYIGEVAGTGRIATGVLDSFICRGVNSIDLLNEGVSFKRDENCSHDSLWCTEERGFGFRERGQRGERGKGNGVGRVRDRMKIYEECMCWWKGLG